MSTVILNGLTAKEISLYEDNLIDGIKNGLPESEDFQMFRLEDLDIKHCISCGSCAYKSPGRCVFEDDVHDVMRAVALSKHVVLLTGVRFGGYSSTLKKAVDKFMLLALPCYSIYKGTMVHPSRYGPKMLIGIGLAGNLPEDEVESFKKLVAHNAHNLQSSHLALVTEPDLSAAGIKEWFQNNLQGGGRNE